MAIVTLLYFQGMIFHPYMGSALAVNAATLVAASVSLGHRNLFYAPLLVCEGVIVLPNGTL